MGPSVDGVLLERQGELAAITGALDEAERGAGRALLVCGEAGIGKTALLAAARKAARERGQLVAVAAGGMLEGEFAYGVVRELFEPLTEPRLLEGAAAAAAPALGRRGARSAPFGADARVASFELEHGLYWLVANLAERGALLVAVDDAQWSDRDSLRFLVYLARRLEELAVTLLAAVREGEEGLAEELAALRALPTVTQLALAGLSEAAVAVLVRGRFGAGAERAFCRACHEASGGNPFLLGALLDELAAEGVQPTAGAVGSVGRASPAAVQRSVLLRLARLGSAAVALAEAVAVLEPDAELVTAARLAGLEEAQAGLVADRLIAAGVLRPAHPLSFAHPLLRSALYANLGVARRSSWHRRAAELLERRAPERVGPHLLATLPASDGWVLERLRAAAEQELARGSPRRSRVLLERALAEAAAGEERAEVLLALGEAEAREVDAAAVPRLEAAVRLTGDAALRARARRTLVTLHWQRGETEAAAELLDQATVGGGTAAAETEELEAERALLLALTWPARTQPSELTLRPVHQVERLPGNTAAERRLLAALAFHRLIWGETTGPEVGRVAERALGGGRLLTDAGVGHPSVLAALSVLQAVDRDNEVEGALREARRLWGSRGGAREQVILAALEARLALFRGQLREAGAAAHEALQIATAAGSESGRQLALACLVPVLVERGELDAAEAALGSTGTDTHNSAAFGTRWLMLQARMALRQAQGRFAEAAGDARRALAERAGQAGRPLPGAGRLALALDAAGEREQARRLAAASAGHARRWGVRSTLGVALRIAGLVEGGERGLALLDDAAQALAATRRRLEYARALVELGAAQRRANRRSDAREPLAEGMELAHRCGARPLVGRARDELRACGARPRRPVRSGVDALTPSELRVAQHAAAGLTNREIAQTLFVSRKTVETHLAAVYRKLHVNRRDALAERLAGDGKAASAPPRRGAPVRRD